MPRYRIAGIDFFREDHLLCARRSPGSASWYVLPPGAVLLGLGWLMRGLPLHRVAVPAISLPVLLFLLFLFLLAGAWRQIVCLRRPYRFDGTTGLLFHGKAAVCPLGSICHLELYAATNLSGRGGISYTCCRLLLLYATGDVFFLTQTPVMQALRLFEFDTPEQAMRVAAEIAGFLGISCFR
jgi:hypothetical protein